MKTEYKPLSKTQKARLSILAREGYKIHSQHGVTDQSFADWRHEQQMEAVGCESLTKCIQRDYLPLVAHFQSLTGQDGDAFNTHMQNQPANDHADPEDTHEARKQVIGRIEKELEGSKYSLGYICAIAKNQYRTTKLENLTKKQLTQLLMTAKKRVATASK